jgi:hypothetical protein
VSPSTQEFSPDSTDSVTPSQTTPAVSPETAGSNQETTPENQPPVSSTTTTVISPPTTAPVTAPETAPQIPTTIPQPAVAPTRSVPSITVPAPEVGPLQPATTQPAGEKLAPVNPTTIPTPTTRPQSEAVVDEPVERRDESTEELRTLFEDVRAGMPQQPPSIESVDYDGATLTITASITENINRYAERRNLDASALVEENQEQFINLNPAALPSDAVVSITHSIAQPMILTVPEIDLEERSIYNTNQMMNLRTISEVIGIALYDLEMVNGSLAGQEVLPAGTQIILPVETEGLVALKLKENLNEIGDVPGTSDFTYAELVHHLQHNPGVSRDDYSGRVFYTPKFTPWSGGVIQVETPNESIKAEGAAVENLSEPEEGVEAAGVVDATESVIDDQDQSTEGALADQGDLVDHAGSTLTQPDTEPVSLPLESVPNPEPAEPIPPQPSYQSIIDGMSADDIVDFAYGISAERYPRLGPLSSEDRLEYARQIQEGSRDENDLALDIITYRLLDGDDQTALWDQVQQILHLELAETGLLGQLTDANEQLLLKEMLGDYSNNGQRTSARFLEIINAIRTQGRDPEFQLNRLITIPGSLRTSSEVLAQEEQVIDATAKLDHIIGYLTDSIQALDTIPLNELREHAIVLDLATGQRSEAQIRNDLMQYVVAEELGMSYELVVDTMFESLIHKYEAVQYLTPEYAAWLRQWFIADAQSEFPDWSFSTFEADLIRWQENGGDFYSAVTPGYTPPESARSTAEAPHIADLLPLQAVPNLGPMNSEGKFRLPESIDGSYVFHDGTPERSRCGNEVTLQVIYTVAQVWNQIYPEATIEVGDLDEEAGHNTHNHGHDVDITTKNKQAANIRGNPVMSLHLAQLFARTGAVEKILFNDPWVISEFTKWAQEDNIPVRMVYYPNHDDHFHVDVRGTPGQYSGQCAADTVDGIVPLVENQAVVLNEVSTVDAPQPEPELFNWIVSDPSLAQWQDEINAAEQAIRQVGRPLSLNNNMVSSTIFLETGGAETADNGIARGLMQFTDGTWDGITGELQSIGIHVDNPLEGQDSIIAGMHYMQNILDARDGNLAAVPIMYHSGGGGWQEFLKGKRNGKYYGPKTEAYAVRWLALVQGLATPNQVYQDGFVEQFRYLLNDWR